MDDAKNERTARAPEFQDLLKLCRSLNDQGVEYVVIGGFAVMLHGGGRFTKDIDLLVRETQENVRKIKKAMSILPDNAAALIADDDVAKYQVVRIGDEFVVDLMAAACGIRYEEAFKAISWKEIEGVRIPVANIELLLKTKATYRDQDKLDSMFLRERLEKEGFHP